MYPFSFLEYLEYLEIEKPTDTDLIDYMQIGGFPQALELHKISNSAYENYLKGLYTTILEKDIKPRNQIYNEVAFDNLTRFLSDSVGSLTMRNEATRERELSAFIKLKNHHPKMVITLDPEEPTYNGIVQKNATKWLMER
ncbi:hypothetical protein FACS189440_13710 [Bacteroidia bacterium]|nr:hypothetical protein FACS189440_13710 [Bacteroidia bacterium]